MSEPTAELIPLDAAWDERWDALAAEAPEAGFMQSSAWAAFKRAEGYQTLRYGLVEDGRLWGGALLLFYPAHGAEGYYLCPEGPVLPWHDAPRARAGLKAILAETRRLAAERGGLGLRIEPHLPPPPPRLLRGWTRAPADLTPAQTVILDLTRSDEELLAAMHPKFRYNLRLSARHGVEVEESDRMADLERFHLLFTDTGRRQGFFTEPFGFLLNLGAALFPTGQARLYFARWGGEDLAGLLIVFYGRRATYLYGGSLARHRQVMPNHALHWAVIHGARERGCCEYDLYGYDPYGRPDHLFAGISRFKRQFGGQRHDRFGAYDQVFYDRLADVLVQRLGGLG